MRLFLYVSVFLFALNSYAAIFGSDDRKSVFANSANYKYGQSTAVAVLSSLIEPDPQEKGTYKIATSALSDLICKNERFSNMPSLDYACSGFLVAPDLIVTAGHCMVNVGISQNESELYCEAYSWLFDFKTDPQGRVQTEKIPAENHYRCKKIVFAVNEEKAPFRDFALVQLDRPVVGRLPLTINSTNVKLQQSVHMIGYPMGIPMTYTGNAHVVYNDVSSESFFTNLDAFDGNSGSAVFNNNNEVIGILIAGTPATSFVKDIKTQNMCHRYNKCNNEGRNCTEGDGEWMEIPGVFDAAASAVQKIAPIVELMNGLETSTK